MHHVTRMLENNSFVRCLLVDFSKAFDRVDHVVLVQKLSKLNLPEYIFNWLISSYWKKSHCSGIESNPLPINLRIVQGSVLGPSL
jgi:ribonucleases P/MRP protein subunit RPP40